MRLPAYLSTILFSCFIGLFSNIVFAEQKIDFSDETVAQDVLLNTTWNCTLTDEYYSGPTTWKFEKIKGKKVSGYTLWCNEKAKVKGKLKKNILKYTLTTPNKGNCNTSGTLEFFIDEDDFTLARGQYRYTAPDLQKIKKGVIHECHSFSDDEWLFSLRFTKQILAHYVKG